MSRSRDMFEDMCVEADAKNRLIVETIRRFQASRREPVSRDMMIAMVTKLLCQEHEVEDVVVMLAVVLHQLAEVEINPATQVP